MAVIQCHRGTTLEYILQDEETETDILIEGATPNAYDNSYVQKHLAFHGILYEQDNNMLYTVLRHSLTSTSGWNMIARFSKAKTCRGAYLA